MVFQARGTAIEKAQMQETVYYIQEMMRNSNSLMWCRVHDGKGADKLDWDQHKNFI